MSCPKPFRFIRKTSIPTHLPTTSSFQMESLKTVMLFPKSRDVYPLFPNPLRTISRILNKTIMRIMRILRRRKPSAIPGCWKCWAASLGRFLHHFSSFSCCTISSLQIVPHCCGTHNYPDTGGRLAAGGLLTIARSDCGSFRFLIADFPDILT